MSHFPGSGWKSYLPLTFMGQNTVKRSHLPTREAGTLSPAVFSDGEGTGFGKQLAGLSHGV